MTREQVKEIMPDATDEQITAFLNENMKEVAKERNEAKKYKDDAKKAEDLQKELEEIKNGNLTEVEKIQKAADEATRRAEDMEKKLARMEQLNNLAGKGITGEQAEKLISEDGKLDLEILGQIISEKEKAAAVAKEKEIADKQGNPGGGGNTDGHDGDEKPDDVKNAEGLSFGATNDKSATEAQNYYK